MKKGKKLTVSKVLSGFWKKSDGYINLQLGAKADSHCITIGAGSYLAKPDEYFGVNVTAEIEKPCDVRVSIKDFSVPTNLVELDNALLESLKAILRGEILYVGCLGGTGRTGMYLGLLAGLLVPVSVLKYNGDRVGYVRNHYKSNAVETDAQEDFVLRYSYSKACKKLAKEIQKSYK